jgi:hypothetical protein
MLRRLGLAALALCAAGAATAAADDQPICADRPGKGTGTCTVPAGHWQVETGLIDWTHDRSGGVTSDAFVIGSTLIKYGISSRADVEVDITPYQSVREHGFGFHAHDSSFGDTLLRVKYLLTGDDSPFEVALDPFVKLPTANHRLGNGKVEAGLAVPTGMALGKGPLSLFWTPEVDWRVDGDGHGYHAAMSHDVGLGWQVTDKLNLSGDLFAEWDWDRRGTGKQYSADGSAAYLVSNDVQLDAGANFGLNKQTPDIELYAGVSKRF